MGEYTGKSIGFLIRFIDIALRLTDGMGRSVVVFCVTLMLSLPLGLLVCFGRMSRIPLIRWLTTLYISLMRGTPLMLQLYVWYFGPYYIFNIPLTGDSRFYAVIIGFAVNYAAYFAEIYRGGIQAIPIGQYEAAQVLGYSKARTFFKIILPQVIRHIIPSITNETITLIKDTSLSNVIAYAEMFTEAKRISSATASLMPLAVAGIFYFTFNSVVAWGMDKLEHKLAYYR